MHHARRALAEVAAHAKASARAKGSGSTERRATVVAHLSHLHLEVPASLTLAVELSRELSDLRLDFVEAGLKDLTLGVRRL